MSVDNGHEATDTPDEPSQNHDPQTVPVGALALPSQSPVDPALPRRIGRYTIRERIGQGGMGVVYLADQKTPRRRVAVKVSTNGPVSGTARERFSLESEALARLDHPGLCTIFEAGTTDDADGGRSFFAMEYIDGPTLSRYVRDTPLSLQVRVELVAQLAEAIHHAHQRGIVHRDLKPNNVLIDAQGQPKIVDFGVAMTLDAAQRRMTRTGELVGTVSYMSPEQCRGDSRRIDTRTDIYSLGVIAYELFTGCLPFDLESTSLPAAARTIVDRTPKSLGTIDRSLRGDLETIVATAMAKEPDDRYDSAAELALDLRRFLDREPISARPASGLYSLGKLVSRHRTLTALLVVLLLGTLLAVGTISHQFAARQREFEVSQAYLQAFDQMHRALSLVQNGSTVEAAVDQLFEEARQTPIDDPTIRAEVLMSWGSCCESLHRYDTAAEFIREALRLRESHLGPLHKSTIYAAVRLSNPLCHADRAAEAAEHARVWYERLQNAKGPKDENTLRFSSDLAAILAFLGDYEGAAEQLTAQVELRERTHASYHPDLGRDRMNLAKTLARSGDLLRARAEAERAYAGHLPIYGPHNSLAVEAQILLGSICALRREWEPAEEHFAYAEDGILAEPPTNTNNRLELLFERAKLADLRGEADEADQRFAELEEQASESLRPDSRRLRKYREHRRR